MNLDRVFETLTSKHWSYIYRESAPSSLIEALKRELPHINPLSWAQRLSWGGVYVNGRACFGDRPLEAPCRVEYYEPKFDLAEAGHVFPPLKREHIIYEDDELIAVFKPAKLPCLPTREQKHFNLRSKLLEYLNTRNSSGTLHLPSRLDTSASGLVIASKSARMHKELQRLFEKRQIIKSYLLETPGRVDWDETQVNLPIGKDSRHPVLRKVVQDGGKDAVTTFHFLYGSEFNPQDGPAIETSILCAKPLTGRTHQIRVHALTLEGPIIGDNFYGGLPAGNLHLLSYQLQFKHPFTHKTMDIRVPDGLFPPWLDPSRL